jgi:hypothetical protein
LVALGLISVFGAENVKLIALGAFRVGNPAFAAFEDKQFLPGNFIRLTHAKDGVPRIPPKKLGYVHGGTEYWMQAKKTVDGSQIKLCNGPEDPTCIQQFGDSLNPINGVSHK